MKMQTLSITSILLLFVTLSISYQNGDYESNKKNCCCKVEVYRELLWFEQQKSQKCTTDKEKEIKKINSIKTSLGGKRSGVKIHPPKRVAPTKDQLKALRDRLMAMLDKITFSSENITSASTTRATITLKTLITKLKLSFTTKPNSKATSFPIQGTMYPHVASTSATSNPQTSQYKTDAIKVTTIQTTTKPNQNTITNVPTKTVSRPQETSEHTSKTTPAPAQTTSTSSTTKRRQKTTTSKTTPAPAQTTSTSSTTKRRQKTTTSKTTPAPAQTTSSSTTNKSQNKSTSKTTPAPVQTTSSSTTKRCQNRATSKTTPAAQTTSTSSTTKRRQKTPTSKTTNKTKQTYSVSYIEQSGGTQIKTPDITEETTTVDITKSTISTPPGPNYHTSSPGATNRASPSNPLNSPRFLDQLMKQQTNRDAQNIQTTRDEPSSLCSTSTTEVLATIENLPIGTTMSHLSTIESMSPIGVNTSTLQACAECHYQINLPDGYYPKENRHVICPSTKTNCIGGLGVCCSNQVTTTIYMESEDTTKQFSGQSQVYLTFNSGCSCQLSSAWASLGDGN